MLKRKTMLTVAAWACGLALFACGDDPPATAPEPTPEPAPCKYFHPDTGELMAVQWWLSGYSYFPSDYQGSYWSEEEDGWVKDNYTWQELEAWQAAGGQQKPGIQVVEIATKNNGEYAFDGDLWGGLIVQGDTLWTGPWSLGHEWDDPITVGPFQWKNEQLEEHEGEKIFEWRSGDRRCAVKGDEL